MWVFNSLLYVLTVSVALCIVFVQESAMPDADFIDNGQSIFDRSEHLTDANFQAYIEKYGIDRAKGYLDAIADINKVLVDALGVPPRGGTGLPNSPTKTRNAVRDLWLANDDILKNYAEKFLGSTSHPIFPKR